MELEILFADREQGVATFGPVNIRILQGARTELADMEQLAGLIDKTLTRWPIAGIFAVIHHGTPVPDGPARRFANRVFEGHGDRLVAVNCMLGLGFWATAARAATVAMTRLQGLQIQIEASVETSVERLCMDMIGVDSARLLAAHDELARRMERSSARAA